MYAVIKIPIPNDLKQNKFERRQGGEHTKCRRIFMVTDGLVTELRQISFTKTQFKLIAQGVCEDWAKGKKNNVAVSKPKDC